MSKNEPKKQPPQLINVIALQTLNGDARNLHYSATVLLIQHDQPAVIGEFRCNSEDDFQAKTLDACVRYGLNMQNLVVHYF